MSANSLIFAGALLLAPGESVQLSGPSSQIWISDARVLEGHVVGGRLVLQAKGAGLAHFTRGKDIERALVTSVENLRAARRCPQAGVEVEGRGLRPTDLSSAHLKILRDCGFRELVLPEFLANASEAKPGRTLLFELSFFEFSRRRAEELGLQLPTSLRGRMTPGQGFRLEALELGADFGERLGVAKVLARPRLRTKPGERATFQSGGEIPVRTSTLYGQQTHWKNYGLQLTLDPDAKVTTGAGEIGLGLKLELSEPDVSAAVDGAPGLTLRKLESRFDLRVGQTTLLTTMIQTRSGTRRAGFFGSTGPSLLARLFSSESLNAEDSELYIAIRPDWESAR